MMSESDTPGTPTKNVLFSPVKVSGGPPSSHVNLTGIPRKIKDSCADIYNFVQKWNKLNANGTLLMNKIASEKIRSLESSGSDVQDHSGPETSDSHSEKISELCSLLLDIWKEMEEQVNRVAAIRDNLEAVAQLDEQHGDRDQIPFQTWPVRRFYETSEKIVGAYRKELEVKKCLLEDVPHGKDSKVLCFLVTAWTYDPYIDDDCKLCVEAMVTEVGFK
ncbi:cyclin-dependent kinase 2-interacting protein-like [Ornithodoros turicata]|uniref:cyclin-dependent kinase 2-interacting protein-like n=1 Tax=Ornithodoros turicata TaxID=34597 RepID=UPI00313A2F5D